jgi:hypothetical protein
MVVVTADWYFFSISHFNPSGVTKQSLSLILSGNTTPCEGLGLVLLLKDLSAGKV